MLNTILLITTIIILLISVYIYLNLQTKHGYAVSVNQANLGIFLNLLAIALILIYLVKDFEYYSIILSGLIVGINIVNLFLLSKVYNSKMDNNANLNLVLFAYILNLLLLIFFVINYFIEIKENITNQEKINQIEIK